MAVDKGGKHLAVQHLAFERAPAAFVIDIAFVHLPGLARIHHREVGSITRPQESSPGNLEQTRRPMAHGFNYFRQRKYALMYQFQHHRQAVADPRRTRWAFEIGLLLFFVSMGRMIGSHDQLAALDGPAQSLPVLCRLDSRIALHPPAVFPVILIRKPEVMHANLARNAVIAQQFQFLGRGKMQDMQLGAMLASQSRRLARRLVAGFRAPDQGMYRKRSLLPVSSLEIGCVLPYHALFLAMRRHYRRGVGKQSLQIGRILHQHIAGGRTEKDLDAADIAGIGLEYFLQVVLAASHIKGIVDAAVFGSHPVFLHQKFLSQRLGLGVGHIHERSDPAFERGQGLGSDIALMGQSGLPEMHLVVDDAGQHISPLQVDFLIRPWKGFPLSHQPYPGDSIRCPFDTFSRPSY